MSQRFNKKIRKTELRLLTEIIKRLASGSLSAVDIESFLSKNTPEQRPLDVRVIASFGGCYFTEANFRERIIYRGQSMRRHRNGGGWVPVDQSESDESKAYVAPSVYVGPFARIRDNARVTDNAHIFGDAQVYDSAQVSGDARVFGSARVYGHAIVYGYAMVDDHARIFGDAQVHGRTRVCEGARVYGRTRAHEGKITGLRSK